MQLASQYCLSSLIALCEQVLRSFVDYDNVAPIFLISQRCEASQLLAYCAYFSRKYEHHLCESLTPKNASDMCTLARECRLVELTKAAEPLVRTQDADHDDFGCGESKSGRNDIMRTPVSKKSRRTPRPPAPILSRERMWSA